MTAERMRWTVVARAPSRVRRLSAPRVRARVFVRCVCGVERVLWLEDIQSGHSTGCESRWCAARYVAALDARKMLDSWVERELELIKREVVRFGGQCDPALLSAIQQERAGHIDHAIAEYLKRDVANKRALCRQPRTV